MLVKSQNKDRIKVPFILSKNSIDEFLNTINTEIKLGNKSVNISCVQFDSITSSHVGLIWKAFLLCKKSSVKMKVCDVSPPICKIFNLLDLDNILTIEKSHNTQSIFQENKDVVTPIKKIFEKEFEPTTEAIRDIKLQINIYMNENNFEEQFTYEIETIFYEVLTNIRLHSKTKKTDTVIFSLSFDDNSIYMKFIDKGIPFNPLENKKDYDPSQSIKIKQKNGFGIYMICKMTNEVIYERKKDKNILNLRKNLGVE